ncbi:MAG: hypothetical protein ACREIH_02550 [Nitrospiraceae bacterium]
MDYKHRIASKHNAGASRRKCLPFWVGEESVLISLVLSLGLIVCAVGGVWLWKALAWITGALVQASPPDLP